MGFAVIVHAIMIILLFQTHDWRPKTDVGPINKNPIPDNNNPMMITHLGHCTHNCMHGESNNLILMLYVHATLQLYHHYSSICSKNEVGTEWSCMQCSD